MKPKIQMLETKMSAKEFIALLERAVFSDDELDSKLAEEELKQRMCGLAANREKTGQTEHSKN